MVLSSMTGVVISLRILKELGPCRVRRWVVSVIFDNVISSMMMNELRVSRTVSRAKISRSMR